jgi:HEAT repeat protein
MMKLVLAVVLLVVVAAVGAEIAYVSWQFFDKPTRPDPKDSVVFKGELLRKWAENLKSDDVTVRRQAATGLIEIPPKPDGQYMIGTLSNALSDADNLTRCRAGAALGRILTEAPIPAPLTSVMKPELLIEVLKDPDPDVRAEAVRAFASFGPMLGVAVPALTYLAKNGENEDTRKAAASALEKIQRPDKLPETKALGKERGKTDAKATDAKEKEEKGKEKKGADAKAPDASSRP